MAINKLVKSTSQAAPVILQISRFIQMTGLFGDAEPPWSALNGKTSTGIDLLLLLSVCNQYLWNKLPDNDHVLCRLLQLNLFKINCSWLVVFLSRAVSSITKDCNTHCLTICQVGVKQTGTHSLFFLINFKLCINGHLCLWPHFLWLWIS